MARRNRDLAGLAALGALGYMATRGREDVRGVGEGRKESVESETRRQTPARAEDDRDIGMISGASPSGLYRNTESGDIFSMNRPEAAPTRTPARPASGRMPSADEDFPPASSSKSPRRNVAGDYTRKMGARPSAAEIDSQMQALARGREREPEYVSKRKPNVVYDAQGNEVRPLKKGGAVKKMASGGMTASKRADGIASRGKTKCKMY